MEALRTTWSFLLLFSLLAFSQLCGVLLFFRIKRYQHFLAHSLAFVLPIILTVGFSWMIFIYRYYSLHPGDRDGGQLLGASLVILLVAGMQVLVGLFVQFALHARVHSCTRSVLHNVSNNSNRAIERI